MGINERWIAAIVALAGGAGPAMAANHVDALGREWAPLTTLTHQSWDQIDSRCQNTTEAQGACQGVLGGVDLTGWTWASRAEVVTFIGEFMAAAGDATPPSTMTGPHGYGTQNDAWAAPAIAAMGTTAPAIGAHTFGFTSENYCFAWLCTGTPCGRVSYAAAGEQYGGSSEFYGAWFYRMAPVPEPSSVALMLAGAAGLVGVRRLRTRRIA